jgi:hypothetical protein
MRDWGIRVVDDRPTADVYIDVTRPFLTFDWEFKVIDNRTGAVLGSGKAVAWDGHIAAPQLAIEIIKIFRGARPLPSPKEIGLARAPAETAQFNAAAQSRLRLE